MDWKAHLFLGVLAGFAVAFFGLGIAGGQLAVFCAVAGTGALLPDIDLRKSKVSQLTYGIAAALILLFSLLLSNGDGARMLLYAAAMALALLALDFLARPRHRGITHGLLLALALAAAAFLLFGQMIASALLAGYLSHLLADGVVKLA